MSGTVGQPGKKYGLTLNPKAVARVGAPASSSVLGRKRPASQISSAFAGKPVAAAALKNVFGNDDDDEEALTQEEVNRRLAAGDAGGAYAELRQRRRQRDLENVLLQDETAFEYDAVYGEVQAQREVAAAAHQAQKQERQARYIGDLLKHAESREREQNIIYERRLLKERQREDHLFGDKERFVTSAYKQKLLEEELWKQEQAVKDARDQAKAAELRGEQGLGAFHRNLMAAGGSSRSGLVLEDRRAAEEARAQADRLAELRKQDFMESHLRPRSSDSSSGGRKRASSERQAEEDSQQQPAAGRSRSREPPEAASASTSSSSSRSSEAVAAASLEASQLQQQQQQQQQEQQQAEQLQQDKADRELRAQAARERFLARKRQKTATAAAAAAGAGDSEHKR